MRNNPVALNLRSRTGDEFIVMLVLLIPLLVIIMGVALDGMSMASAYRRAQGLAQVSANAGAARLTFGGTSPAIDERGACMTAYEVFCENARGCLPPVYGNGHAHAACTVAGGVVTVRVDLKPIRIFGGPLSLPDNEIVAVARAQLRYGINFGE